MDATNTQSPPILLLAGDGLALLIVTWIGFASHGESLLTPRWLLTFVPLLAAWALAAPWLGAYMPGTRCSTSGIWRAALAMLLAAPLATFLRAILIGETLTPVVFIAVMMGVSALGMAAWRSVWWLICKRTVSHGRS